MSNGFTPDLTGYLKRWREGDDGAFGAMLPHVYERLQQMARA